MKTTMKTTMKIYEEIIKPMLIQEKKLTIKDYRRTQYRLISFIIGMITGNQNIQKEMRKIVRLVRNLKHQ